VLIKPRHTPARSGPEFQIYDRPVSIPHICDSANRSRFLAVDFETTGGDVLAPGFGIVGVGLAWDEGSVYLDWDSVEPMKKFMVIGLLLSHKGLLAHNIYFDGAVIRKLFGQHAQWFCCTLAAYKRTANEGWPGQRHGLKQAMTDILLWTDSNEKDLDQWLCLNGYYQGNRRKDDTPEGLMLAFSEGKLSPRKDEMWRAPADILGKYCVLDAEACYLLFTEHLFPVMERFPDLHDYLTKDFMYCVKVHIDQKFHGILMDRKGLLARKEFLESELDRLGAQFFTHERVAPAIEAIEQKMMEEFLAAEPPQYKKQRVRPPEPTKFKKDGSVSKTWENWVLNEHKYEPQISGNWLNWKDKLDAIVRKENSDYLFNPNSGQQLAVLLYDYLRFPIVESLRTEKGSPGTSIKALKQMGEIGNLLVEKAWITKELGYITDYLDRTEARPTLHPSFRLPGTTTGRLSSSTPNLQQVPKSKAVMSLFQARPGNVLVDLDFSALEPVVATEFSQDPNMMKIYGDSIPSTYTEENLISLLDERKITYRIINGYLEIEY
jgi:hypothetical protein